MIVHTYDSLFAEIDGAAGSKAFTYVRPNSETGLKKVDLSCKIFLEGRSRMLARASLVTRKLALAGVPDANAATRPYPVIEIWHYAQQKEPKRSYIQRWHWYKSW